MLRGVVLIAAIFVDNYFNPRDPETETVGDLENLCNRGRN